MSIVGETASTFVRFNLFLDLLCSSEAVPPSSETRLFVWRRMVRVFRDHGRFDLWSVHGCSLRSRQPFQDAKKKFEPARGQHEG